MANTDKAQLATIIPERLKNHSPDYESLLIFADQADRPRPVLARLSHVGGEQIASLDARDDMERRILRKVAVTRCPRSRTIRARRLSTGATRRRSCAALLA
ncbi:MAG: hypothetical protein ACOH13_14175 [Flavobacteriales bacterium]